MDRWKLASIALALVACTIALASAAYVAGQDDGPDVAYENEGNSEYRGITPAQKDIDYNADLDRPTKDKGPV
ncbi:MAG: hypothetical protein ACXACI_16720 [Candidatus Hodarchaeales archaeon]|jgi:hypothetical protein